MPIWLAITVWIMDVLPFSCAYASDVRSVRELFLICCTHKAMTIATLLMNLRAKV